MRKVRAVGLAAAMVLGVGAAAQQGVGYRLEAGSQLTEVFCLPPCACPYHEIVGGVTGTFVLTLDHQDPLFRYYTVSAVDWRAELAGVPTAITGSGTYQVGGEVAVQQRIQLDLLVGQDVVRHYDSGLVMADPSSAFPRIGIAATTEFTCRRNELAILASPAPVQGCYANCDGSTAEPILNVNDFVCFLDRFGAGDSYANCDGSTVPPVLNVNDSFQHSGIRSLEFT